MARRKRSPSVVTGFAFGATLLAAWPLNLLRERSLPLVYCSPAERLELEARQSGLAQSGWAESTAEVIDEVQIEEVRAMMASGAVIDARPAVFYRLGHIPGALSLPRENFMSDYPTIKGKLEERRAGAVIVYCSESDCEDSEIVGRMLQKLGYTNISVFRGGWAEWTAAGLLEEKASP